MSSLWIVHNSFGIPALTTKPDGIPKKAVFREEADAQDFADMMAQIQRLHLGPGDHRYMVKEWPMPKESLLEWLE